jgi:hypothetical protein
MELKTHEGNLEVGLTKRLIGIKREVYDFFSVSFRNGLKSLVFLPCFS